MKPARRQTILFLLCAVVLLGAGYGWGYVTSYNHFYSPEAQLDRELLNMDFNSRLLHFTNLRRPDECRRELVRCLNQQITFVGTQIAADPPQESKVSAQTSVRQAKRVIGGLPLAGTPPATEEKSNKEG